MKTLILAITLFVGSLFVSGCGFIFVARSQPYTPGYCFDCHDGARWHRVYTSCEYYRIIVVHDGYKYRPYKHAKHQEYKFVKYVQSRDHEDRDRREKESRDRNDKEERSRRDRN